MRIVIFLGLVALVGCGGGGGDSRLLVSAAASLREAFETVEAEFEELNPGVDVLLNFAGSSTLREQILGGAPADVFASANLTTVNDVVASGQTGSEPVVFARNQLQIAVPSGNPAGINSLEDLADADLLVGLCAPGVPCGDLAREILANAGVIAAVDTNEPDVRSLLTKIEAGELDAGITYVTDIMTKAETVEGIDIPEQFNVVAEYPIVVLASARDEAAAADFVDFVLSDEGQAIMTGFGFRSP